MFDKLWKELGGRFRVAAIRDMRLTFNGTNAMMKVYKSMSDKDCDTWEDMYLMGGEL